VRAALALRQGEPERAIADLRTVLRDFPDRIAPQRMLGQAHAAKGEAALAEDAFERAIRMDPTDSLAYLQLAELRVRNGDNEGALVVLENLLARVPENEAAQQAIARIQFFRARTGTRWRRPPRRFGARIRNTRWVSI
jgi:cytochrome c-type biogenesis protein CcmH/NrfG